MINIHFTAVFKDWVIVETVFGSFSEVDSVHFDEGLPHFRFFKNENFCHISVLRKKPVKNIMGHQSCILIKNADQQDLGFQRRVEVLLFLVSAEHRLLVVVVVVLSILVHFLRIALKIVLLLGAEIEIKLRGLIIQFFDAVSTLNIVIIGKQIIDVHIRFGYVHHRALKTF